MADRRMFAKTIIDSDAFLDMPLSTQALYFHLSMRADDEGFVNNPKKTARMTGCSDDDLKLLAAKKFIIPFESGIVVIKHWKIHNYIRGDRIHHTKYQDEKSLLVTDENDAYTYAPSGQLTDKCQSNVSQLTANCHTEVRLGKDRLVKDREGNRKRFTPPSIEDVTKYVTAQGYSVHPQRFIDFYESNGWKVGRNPMKDWRATVRSWHYRDAEDAPKPDPHKGQESYCPHCGHQAWRNTQSGAYFCDGCRATIKKDEVVWK